MNGYDSEGEYWSAGTSLNFSLARGLVKKQTMKASSTHREILIQAHTHMPISASAQLL